MRKTYTRTSWLSIHTSDLVYSSISFPLCQHHMNSLILIYGCNDASCYSFNRDDFIFAKGFSVPISPPAPIVAPEKERQMVSVTPLLSIHDGLSVIVGFSSARARLATATCMLRARTGFDAAPPDASLILFHRRCHPFISDKKS